ncbi:hypothetical protein PGB90_006352 [Kerria lacca]
MLIQKKMFLILFLINSISYSFIDGNYLQNNLLGEKRGAVYPPFTVLQFAVGLAVPAQVTNRTIFTNLGTLSNIPLPSKVSQLYPYARHGGFLLTHTYVYKFLNTVFKRYNQDGGQCILKTICEFSKINVNRANLIHKILHLIFSLSKLQNVTAGNDYFIAEQMGKNVTNNCSELYPMCRLILLLIMAHFYPVQANTSDIPRTLVISSGGIIKLIVGMSMPIELPVSLVWIQNFQFQYPMIDNAVQLSYLNLLRKSKSITLQRNTVYRHLAEIWNRKINGTSCVLRLLCEINKYSYSNNGILGVLLETTFTPHKNTEKIYTDAMKIGRSKERCDKYYLACKTNILELLNMNLTGTN